MMAVQIDIDGSDGGCGSKAANNGGDGNFDVNGSNGGGNRRQNNLSLDGDESRSQREWEMAEWNGVSTYRVCKFELGFWWSLACGMPIAIWDSSTRNLGGNGLGLK
ncbi:hypothetical protein Adt_37630 [Abeliophyllum distichum]|uniref:Uncharacterized protein n=1 Tax=Abeliophyllum distichum TaxID=126358 RepID=A0ABD1Q2V5_9LAMI